MLDCTSRKRTIWHAGRSRKCREVERRPCKFGPSIEDQDNFKLVRSNVKDLYKNALKTSELSVILRDIDVEAKSKTVDDKNLQARFAALEGNS